MMNLTSDLLLTVIITGLAFLAVWVPLGKGLRVCMRSMAATRRVPVSQLKTGTADHSGHDPSLALLLAGTLRKVAREAPDQPREFLLDASRQYVTGEWESHYGRLVSMYANLMPPIGFIGTTAGLFVLFISRRMADAPLELGALALALTTSIFALIGFAVLEAIKIRLYARLLTCLDDVVQLAERSGSRRAAAEPAQA
jgi:hypothetical protein